MRIVLINEEDLKQIMDHSLVEEDVIKRFGSFEKLVEHVGDKLDEGGFDLEITNLFDKQVIEILEEL